MKVLFLACLMLMMTACAAVDVGASGARVPVQFALLKTMQENPGITADVVLRETAHFRKEITSNPNIDIKALLADAFIRYGIARADPESQMYLRLLFFNIEQAVNDIGEDLPPNEQQVRLLTFLDWIDQAAGLKL